MKQYNSNSPHLFPELEKAIQNGYPHDFTLSPSGELRCLSKPEHLYGPEEVEVVFIHCAQKATLYLVVTKDGLYSGTYIDYWEC